MKTRFTVSVEEELVPQIRELMRKERIFKNKSHIVEYALFEFLKNRGMTRK
jgi:Arc/MetJ-type ribon-helix-helix transcriptional regulator